MNNVQLGVQLRLPDGWRDVDPYDPLPGQQYAEILRELVAMGLPGPKRSPDEPILLSSVLVEPPLPEFPDEPPLFASAVIQRRSGRDIVPVSVVEENAIVPIRNTGFRSIAFPGDGPDVTFFVVTYYVPDPSGEGFYVATFATPNLPLQEEMEFLFDSIMSTMEWVEQDAA
jgi:hypothetical protein